MLVILPPICELPAAAELAIVPEYPRPCWWIVGLVQNSEEMSAGKEGGLTRGTKSVVAHTYSLLSLNSC